MNFWSHASKHRGLHWVGGPPSWVFVFRTPKDWTRGRGSVGAWEGTWTISLCDASSTADPLPATEFDFPKSSYNFLYGTLSDAEGDIREVMGSHDRRGEGEQDLRKRWVPLGGLSTTPSSTGLVEKSIVELAVVAEQRKFPVLRIAFWPYSKKESSDATHGKMAPWGTKVDGRKLWKNNAFTLNANKYQRIITHQVQPIQKYNMPTNWDQANLINNTSFEIISNEFIYYMNYICSHIWYHANYINEDLS